MTLGLAAQSNGCGVNLQNPQGYVVIHVLFTRNSVMPFEIQISWD
jgi:hypothetical protein